MASRFTTQPLGGDLSGPSYRATVNKVGGVTVSAFAKTILDDADASAMRSTLGVSAGGGSALDHATLTAPGAVSGWTQFNAGPATFDDIGVFQHIKDAAHSSYNVRGLDLAVPSAPYTRTALIRLHAYDGGDFYAGMCLRDGSGLMALWGLWRNGGSWWINHSNWNSATSWNAHVQREIVPWRELVWLQIEDNNTNRIVRVSPNGQTGSWLTFSTVTRTSFLTPTRLGWFMDNSYGSSGPDAQAFLLSWA